MGKIVHIIKFEFGPLERGYTSMVCGDVSIGDGESEYYSIIYLDEYNNTEEKGTYKPFWSGMGPD